MRYEKYTETHDPHEYHLVSIPCPKNLGGCGSREVITVKAPDLFAHNQGKHVQQAFPYLTVAQRERLLTGYCQQCFDALFAGQEDEEDLEP